MDRKKYEDYEGFVEKFKPKLTTDDCYTPDNIYQVVLDWACKEYGIDPANVVRPFWPGGDFERYPYKEGSVVVDNPPFSIITRICKWYNAHGVKFFLFAPYLTNFSTGADTADIQHIITDATITYQNGAGINTSFLTNLDSYFIRSAPDLQKAIKVANDDNLKEFKKQVPKYSYPAAVISSTSIGYLASHGVAIKIPHADVRFVRALDSQRQHKKAIFGAGFLLSERAAAERAAAERAAAERAAAERAAAHVWELSEEEREVIKSLGQSEQAPGWEILPFPGPNKDEETQDL